MPFILFAVGILLKPVVFRILAILGIGIITYSGGEQFIEALGDQLENSVQGLPVQLGQVFGLLNIDKFFSIIISAYGIRLAYKAATGLFSKIGLRQ